MLWHAIPPHFPPFPPRFSPFSPVFPRFPPFSPIFPHFPHFSHFSVAQKRLGDSGVGDFQGLMALHPPCSTLLHSPSCKARAQHTFARHASLAEVLAIIDKDIRVGQDKTLISTPPPPKTSMPKMHINAQGTLLQLWPWQSHDAAKAWQKASAHGREHASDRDCRYTSIHHKSQNLCTCSPHQKHQNAYSSEVHVPHPCQRLCHRICWIWSKGILHTPFLWRDTGTHLLKTHRQKID